MFYSWPIPSDEMYSNKWGIYIWRGVVHVIPECDIGSHNMSSRCKCRPEWDIDLWRHNSYDKREAYEHGPQA